MRVLLVEDELHLAKLIRAALSKMGCLVDHAPTVEIAEEAIEIIAHDLVLLDRKLPDGDGVTLLHLLRRKRPNVPVIVLSAMDTTSNKVEGLNLGADDYLTKPFEMDELTARIRALMRRPAEVNTAILQIGNVTFDSFESVARVNDKIVELSLRELLLLESLMRRAGRTVRRSVIEADMFGVDDEIQSNAMDAHVSRLRRKLADASAAVEIHAVRGVGYLIKVPS